MFKPFAMVEVPFPVSFTTFVAELVVAPTRIEGKLPFMAPGLANPLSVEEATHGTDMEADAARGSISSSMESAGRSFFMLIREYVNGRGLGESDGRRSCPVDA